MSYLVYKATNIINGKCYIGKTSLSLNKRRVQHNHLARKKTSRNHSYIHKAIAKYGEDNFSWEILHKVKSVDDANMLETKEINTKNLCIKLCRKKCDKGL